MAEVEVRAIDWETAEVAGGTLAVGLNGPSSKAWKERVERVLALLGTPHSAWGKVRVTKDHLKVDEVEQGRESELRHFLESVVLQANTDTEADDGAEPSPQAAETRDEPSADEQMTSTFRAFIGEAQRADRPEP